MAYYRLSPAINVSRARVLEFVSEALALQAAVANSERDPFGIDHDCLNPAGHHFIGSCGDVVCCHCAKVVWR